MTDSNAPRAAQLISNLIRQNRRIVAITHTAPDADAIGGLLGTEMKRVVAAGNYDGN
jgi:nanoRNase/pAp phosphatase (c-di-AMP/oligoRNAs hydrolase)